MRIRLTFRRHYSHPPEKVWRAITEPAALAEWLGWVPECLGFVEPRKVTYAHEDGTISLSLRSRDDGTCLEAVFVGDPERAPVDQALSRVEIVLERMIIDPFGFVWLISEKERRCPSKAEDPTIPESSLT
jgi:hypothetical protein